MRTEPEQLTENTELEIDLQCIEELLKVDTDCIALELEAETDAEQNQ